METQIKIQEVKQIMISETLEWELTLNGQAHTLRIHESDYEGRTIWWDGDEWDQDSNIEELTADDLDEIIIQAESFNFQEKAKLYTRAANIYTQNKT